jgi:hypothetical protein
MVLKYTTPKVRFILHTAETHSTPSPLLEVNDQWITHQESDQLLDSTSITGNGGAQIFINLKYALVIQQEKLTARGKSH